MSGEVGRLAVLGSLSAFGGGVAGFLIRFGANIWFAHEIGPELFGDYALALVYSSFLGLPLSFAFSQALVQFDPGRPGLVDVVLRLTLRQAALVTALGLVAWPIISATQGAGVGACFLGLLPGQILGVLSAAYESVLLRKMRFPFVALVRFVGIAVSLGAALGLCAIAPGPFVYVIRDSAPALVSLAAFWFVVRRRRDTLVDPAERGFHAATARAVWGLGRALFVNRALEMLLNRLDSLLLGAALGPIPLANYEQAKYLAGLPNAAVAPFSLTVGLRTFAAVRNDPPRLARAVSIVQWAIARLVILFTIAVGIAPDLGIRLIFGTQWADAAESLRFLGLWIWLIPLMSNLQVLLTALQAWRSIRVGLIAGSIALASGMLVATLTRESLLAPVSQTAGVAAAIAVMMRATPRELRTRLAVFLNPLIASACAIAAGLGLRAALAATVAPYPLAALGLALGFVTFVVATLAIEGRSIRREIRYLRDVARSRGGHPAADAENARTNTQGG